jgi:sulfur-oxidizing protein SoxY
MAGSIHGISTRRGLLKGAFAGLAASVIGQLGLVLPRIARAAWPSDAFAAKTPDAALHSLFDGQPIIPTDRIHIDLPALAEDGSIVPLTISADLEGVESISVIAGKNPVPLIARFDLGAGVVLPEISTRIKLAETSTVTVVAHAGDRLYSAQRDVKVTHGGCN